MNTENERAEFEPISRDEYLRLLDERDDAIRLLALKADRYAMPDDEADNPQRHIPLDHPIRADGIAAADMLFRGDTARRAAFNYGVKWAATRLLKDAEAAEKKLANMKEDQARARSGAVPAGHVLLPVDALLRHDSYGVDGSDFTVCRLCDAESGAGLLNRGIKHEALCPLAAAPEPPQGKPVDDNGAMHTGNPEADAIINRLNSSDPDFDDCAAAAAWIYRHAQDTPAGHSSWKDAAIAERTRRVGLEKNLAEAPRSGDAPVALRVRYPWSPEWHYVETTKSGADAAAVVKLHAAAGNEAQILYATPPADAPIPMLLFCPKCREQHIDSPEPRYTDNGEDDTTWHNPPHRSHLCHGCGHIWRPADVATTGVASISTKGQRDGSPIPVAPADARDAGEWNYDMAAAPRDSTMVELLIQPESDPTTYNPLDDSDKPTFTIGFNSAEHNDIKDWQFVGWNWCQDCFEPGYGTPIAWRHIRPLPIDRAMSATGGEA